jgi:hypothetical protein
MVALDQFDKDGNDIRLPTLEMDPATLYAGPKTVTGADYIDLNPPWLDKDGNPAKGDPPPDHRPSSQYNRFAVSTSGIRSAETTILAEAYSQKSSFQTFKKDLVSDEGWIYLVSNKHDMEVYWHDEKLPPNTKAGMIFGGGQAAGNYADFTDPNPSQTQETVDAEHALIRAVGDTIESLAHYPVMLNDAVQLYAYTDEQATVPNYTTMPLPPGSGTTW